MSLVPRVPTPSALRRLPAVPPAPTHGPAAPRAAGAGAAAPVAPVAPRTPVAPAAAPAGPGAAAPVPPRPAPGPAPAPATPGAGSPGRLAAGAAAAAAATGVPGPAAVAPVTARAAATIATVATVATRADVAAAAAPAPATRPGTGPAVARDPALQQAAGVDATPPAAPAPPAAAPFSVEPTAARALAAAAGRPSGAVCSSDPARHALNRFGFGAPGGLSGPFDPDAWWDEQVARGQSMSGYAALPGLTTALPALSMDVPTTRTWLTGLGNYYGWDAMTQLAQATLLLQAFSPASLYESLVDFFSNHLNVPNLTGSVTHERTTYDRFIRASVFGDFTTMLLGSARELAMQNYLNLAQSTARTLNENYGRELLELHTVGRSAGYSQAEVVDSARILTGRAKNATTDAYQYVPGRHYVGPVSVLGFHAANGSAADGEAVGDAYLRYLATHPATARHLALKLCLRFVSDTPSDALVAAVADAYLAHGTQILPTVSTIFRSTEFWASRGAKVRRPAENLAATVRALGLTPAASLVKAGQNLSWMSASIGHQPLTWMAPDGFPDVAAAWRSPGDTNYLWTLHLGLASGWWPDAVVTPDPTAWYGGADPRTVGQAVDALSRHLLGATLLPGQRAGLLTYLGATETTPLATSVLRWELTNLVALVLHSPQHAVR